MADIRIVRISGYLAKRAGGMFSKAGKLYDNDKKAQEDSSLEHALFASANTE